MATALICDMCDQEQADMIVTNLGNGDTLAIGSNCLPDFGRTLIGDSETVEGLPPIEGDGSGWPGDVDLSGLGLPPGMDATMAKAWAEAEAEARAELEAEALAAQNGSESPADPPTPPSPPETPEDASEAPTGAETGV